MIPITHAPLRADQRPLYAQASEALRDLVQRNGYAAGDRLPSEIELSQRLGISRPTLREALRHLEEDGLIVRRHGVGTFVAPSEPVIEAGLEVLESIDRIAERHGLSTGMSEARVEERAAEPSEIEGLGVQSDTPITVVTRVIMADGERVAYLTDIVPQTYLRQADLDSDFHGSVLDLLLARGWPGSHTRAPNWRPMPLTPNYPQRFTSRGALRSCGSKPNCSPRTGRSSITRSAISFPAIFVFTSCGGSQAREPATGPP